MKNAGETPAPQNKKAPNGFGAHFLTGLRYQSLYILVKQIVSKNAGWSKGFGGNEIRRRGSALQFQSRRQEDREYP
jgi:hypothetical protein